MPTSRPTLVDERGWLARFIDRSWPFWLVGASCRFRWRTLRHGRDPSSEATTTSITTCRDASLIFRGDDEARVTPGLSSFAQVQPSAPRNQTESKSACERPLRALVRLLQAHSKCCISAQDEGEPRRSAKGRRRDRQKIAAGAAELATAASMRPQRASALAFFAKKSDCCERVVGRRSNVGPSRLVSAVAAASCYA